MKFCEASYRNWQKKVSCSTKLRIFIWKYFYSVSIIGYVVIKAYWHFVIHRRAADSAESNPVKPLALVPGKDNVWLTYAVKYPLN